MQTFAVDSKLNLGRAIARYRRNAIISIQTAYCVGAVGLLFVVSGSVPILASIGLGALLSAVSLLLAVRYKLFWSAFILAGQFLVVPTYLAYAGLGVFDAAVLVFPAGMMAMASVTRPRLTAVYVAVSLACFGLVAHATFYGSNGNPVFFPLVKTNPVDIVSSIVIVGFSGIVAIYVSYILSRLLQALGKYQASLEDRIARRTSDLEKSNEELRAAASRLDRARVDLMRGEKLAGLGSLVAGVSHELNTPIGNSAVAATSLQHVVEEFKRALEAGPIRKTSLLSFVASCEEGAEIIVQSTHRARDLVTSFKQVAVDQTSDRYRPFELNQVITDVLRSLRPSFAGQHWDIDFVPDEEIACVGYPGAIGQVLTNLVQNAIFHGFRDRQDGQLRIVTHALPDAHCRIEVSDNGLGIPESSMGRIFDPFFTTRLGHGGSGLGLTIVHNLVNTVLGGQIEVWSRLGEGTKFTITLPCTAPARSGAPIEA